MKNLILTFGLLAAFAMTGTTAFAKECKNGKPCGNSCIAKDKVCASETKTAKNCKKGKACGDTCIPKDKECKL